MFERFNGNVVPFADESTSTNRTVFGSETQSDDIDDNLNADFKKGWEIVGLNDNPTREDFNAMGYTLGYLTSYLYQNGVAEYNLLQEYKTNSIAIGTDGNIYQSLIDNNIGNALTDATKWICIASKNSIVNSIDELKTISNIESINVLGYYEKGDGGGGIFYWDATSTETDNGGTIIQATGITTGRWKRVFSGAINIRWFGAKGDGATDDTVNIDKAISYARLFNEQTVLIPNGEFIINNYSISNLENINIAGEGKYSSILKLKTGNLNLKSPKYININNLTISADESDIQIQNIYISNFLNISITNCFFKGFGGSTGNKAGSTIMYLYAGDVANSNVNAGSSLNALIQNCDFIGNNRKTNFAVRVYTEFDGVQSSTNIGARIDNCSFVGFNWNAIEVAGVKTSNVIISNCIANSCGLIPFDLDKGANNCLITNCTINRLLGNIDTDVNPQTAVACVGVQGRYANEYATYSYNNIVTDITVNLLASDIESFANEFCCASMSFCKDSIVKNIYVYCDRVPTSTTGDFKFSLIKHETAINCTFENIATKNVQIGIIQSGASATIGGINYTYPTIFKNIKNIGTMTGEVIISDAGGERVQQIFDNIYLKTDMSKLYKTAVAGFSFACRFVASGSSSHFIKIKNSEFDIADVSTNYFSLFQITKLSFDNVKIYGIPVGSRFIHSDISTTPTNLGIRNVLANFGQNPIDLRTVLQYIDQSTIVNCGITDFGTIDNSGAVLYASDIPLYPPVANYVGRYITIENITKTAGSFMGWIPTATGWKTFGAISS